MNSRYGTSEALPIAKSNSQHQNSTTIKQELGKASKLAPLSLCETLTSLTFLGLGKASMLAPLSLCETLTSLTFLGLGKASMLAPLSLCETFKRKCKNTNFLEYNTIFFLGILLLEVHYDHFNNLF